MNLNAYDNIKEKIDKTKTWINIKKEQLLSREINPRRYYSLLKRYNSKTKCYNYFIATLDTPIKEKNYKSITKDSYGRVKICLAEIWSDTYLSQLDSDCNINVSLVESYDDGDIYLLDI